MLVDTLAVRPIDVDDLIVPVLKLPVFNSLLDLIPTKLAKELKLFQAQPFAGLSHHGPQVVNVVLNTGLHFSAPGLIFVDLDTLLVIWVDAVYGIRLDFGEQEQVPTLLTTLLDRRWWYRRWWWRVILVVYGYLGVLPDLPLAEPGVLLSRQSHGNFGRRQCFRHSGPRKLSFRLFLRWLPLQCCKFWHCCVRVRLGCCVRPALALVLALGWRQRRLAQ